MAADTPRQGTWTLEPASALDPACPHCRVPGYAHSHWRQQEAPPRPSRPPGRIMRALFRLYGDGGA
jgi:hypothetical protein